MMADGTVTIVVNVNGKDVTGLNKTLDQLQGKSAKAGKSIRDMALAVGAVKAVSAVFNVLKNSVGDAVSRFDTMQKFPKVMKALGFSASDSNKSIKKLSDGIDGLPTKLDDVVANTQQMTAITGDLDKSTDTVLALNNAFLASGASTEDANRGMQQFNQMLSTGTVDLESWKTLQETMPLALQKTAEAMGYTGKTAQRDLYGALKDGKVTFEDFQTQLIKLGTGTGDLAKLAKENSLGLATSFGNLKNSISKNLANILTKFDEIVKKVSGKTIAQHIDGLKGIINSAGEAIVKSMDNIIPIIEKVTGFVKENATAFKILGGILIGVVAGFVAFQSTVAIMNSVSNAIKGIKTAFSVMKAAILTNPFALLIAGVAALAAGMAYLYKTNEKFKAFADGIIGETGKMISNFLRSREVTELLRKAMDAISGIGQKIAGVFSSIVGAVTKSNSSFDGSNVLLSAFKFILSSLLGPLGLVGKALDFLAKIVGNGSIESGIDKILESISGLSGGIKTYGPQLGQSFGTAIQGILSTIASALPGIIAGGLQIVSGLIMGIAQGLPSLTAAIVQLIGSLTMTIVTLIPTLVASATMIITALLSALATALPQLLAAGVALINSLLQGITQQLPSLIANGSALIVAWLGALTQHLPEIVAAGMELLSQFLQGVASKIGDVTNAAISVIVNFAKAVNSRMGDIVNTAVDLVLNFAKAITSRMPDIIKVGVDLIVSILQGISNNLGRIIDAAINLIVVFLQGIARKISQVVDAAMGIVDALVRGVLQAQGRLMDAAIELINGFANNIRNRKSDIQNAGRNLLEALLGVFVPDSLWSAGKNLIFGFANGIADAASFAVRAASRVARNAVDAVKSALGIHSPSRVFRDQVGKYIPQGIAVGIEGDADTAYKAMKSLSTGLFDGITPEVALGANRVGLANSAGSIINNSSNSKTFSPSVSINIDRADMSSERSIEEQSEELAQLTARQLKGRLGWT